MYKDEGTCWILKSCTMLTVRAFPLFSHVSKDVIKFDLKKKKKKFNSNQYSASTLCTDIDIHSTKQIQIQIGAVLTKSMIFLLSMGVQSDYLLQSFSLISLISTAFHFIRDFFFLIWMWKLTEAVNLDWDDFMQLHEIIQKLHMQTYRCPY